MQRYGRYVWIFAVMLIAALAFGPTLLAHNRHDSSVLEDRLADLEARVSALEREVFGTDPDPTATAEPEPTATSTPIPPTATPEPEPGAEAHTTILARYVLHNTDVYSYEWLRYEPRQVTDDPYAGWDRLVIDASSGFNRVNGTRRAMTVTLHRAATAVLVWPNDGGVPAWITDNWQPDENVGSARAFRRDVAAGDVDLGGLYQSGVGDVQRQWYTLYLAEADGTPSAAPAVPAGHEIPQPNQTCPEWVHDQYMTTGPDGQQYRTWHPQIDAVYWCYFHHEHGSDPSFINAEYEPAFDYTAQTHGMTEPHVGFKGYAWTGTNGSRWYVVQHFGTGGLARACTSHHTIDVTVADANGEIRGEWHLMGNFGASRYNREDVFLTPPDCPNQAREATGNGIRHIPSAHDFVGYEPWRIGGTMGDSTGLGSLGDFTINTHDPVVICNRVPECDVPHVTGLSGTHRQVSGSTISVDINGFQASFSPSGGDPGWGLPMSSASGIQPAERERSIRGHPN